MRISAFELLCYAEHWPTPTPELRFAPPRRWRFDYAFIPQKVAVEIDGAIWTQGRHSRGAGYLKDIEKVNTATALGWRVLKTTPQTVHLLVPMVTALLREPCGPIPEEARTR